MGEIRTLIGDYLFAWRLAWQNCRKYITYYIVSTVVCSTAAFVFDVYFISYILRLLMNGEKWNNILAACMAGAAIVILRILAEAVSGQTEIAFLKINMEKISRKFYEHSLSYNLSDFFSPKFYDRYSYVLSNGPKNANQSVKMLANMLVAVVYTVFFIGEIFTLNNKLIVFIILLLAFKVIVELYMNKRIVDINDSNNLALQPYQRKKDYFRRLFFTREYACDLKNDELFRHVQSEYEGSVEQFKKQRIQNGKRQLTWHYWQITYSNLFQSMLVPLVLVCVLTATGIKDVSVYWEASALFIKLSELYFFRFISDLRALSKDVSKSRDFLEHETIQNDLAEEKCIDKPTIAVRNVSFSYDSNTDFALKDINLEIPYGQKIAIVGRNGSGKTTLLNLMLGLYEPTSGEITMGGRNIRDIDKEQYRKMIGLLCQNFNLYFASVRDNIRMGDDATDEEVLQAAEYAQCMEFIKEFQQGLDTMIGKSFDENAVELSGGQEQRIALARIFLSKAPVIYMDEPTASVDLMMEELINRSLMERLQDKTVVIITHRLDITRFVDKIYVMDNGEVIESGAFEELMNSESVFRDMYHFQNDRNAI